MLSDKEKGIIRLFAGGENSLREEAIVMYRRIV